MAVYESEVIEAIVHTPALVPANKFTFPTDNLIRRWDFAAGAGVVSETISGNAVYALNHYYTNGWIYDTLTAKFAVSCKKTGTISTSTYGYETGSALYSSYLASSPLVSANAFWHTAKGTVSVWVSADWTTISAETSPQGILFMGHEGVYSTSNVPHYYQPNNATIGGHIFLFTRNGILYFMIQQTSSTWDQLSTAIGSIPYGYANITAQWGDGTLELYVNGVLVAQKASTVYPETAAVNYKIMLNALASSSDASNYNNSGGNYTFRDLCFWNRKLLPTEVRAVYNEAVYNPGTVEGVRLYEMAAFDINQYLELLVDGFICSVGAKTDIAIVTGEELSSFDLIGSSLNGATTDQYHFLLREKVEGADVLQGIRGAVLALSEIVHATGTSASIHALNDTVLENVDFGDQISYQDVLHAIELLRCSDLVFSNATLNRVVTEKMNFKSFMVAGWLTALSEGFTLDGTTSWKAEWFISLIERIQLSLSQREALLAVSSVALGLSFLESVASGKGADALEGIEAEEETINKMLSLLAAAEIAAFSDIPDGQLRMFAVGMDRVGATDVPIASATFNEALSAGVAFYATFNSGGTIYSGWVMNTKNFALSEYQNFPFNSFAKVGTQYYAASETGLYLLDGPTDAGEDVQATITLGAMDFTGERKTNVCEAFLALRNDGEIAIKIKTDDNIERWYRMSQESDVLRDRREKFARGVTSRFWTFSLENIDGADFEVHEMTFLPLVMKRRI